MAGSLEAERAAAAAREASLSQRLEAALAREMDARKEVARELRGRLQAQVSLVHHCLHRGSRRLEPRGVQTDG